MASSSGSRRTARAAEFTVPLTIPGGAVAGADVVRELAPEYSLTAWQVLRSTLMWAGEEPALRGDLFEPCAMQDWERELLHAEWEHELRSPLAVIVGELRDAPQAAPDVMARACLCVTEWALPRGYVGTALAFAEAAALCWPDHPRYAWTVGRLLRTHGRLREAEKWIRRSAHVATSSGDHEAKALALNSLGNLYYEQGNYPKAGRTLHEALRASRKHRFKALEGRILHDLFVLSTWSGELEAAEQFAREAFEIYRMGHDRLPSLAHDMAILWMMRGYFSRALFILRDLPAYITAPEERGRTLAALARAAAACGEREIFYDAREQAMEIFSDEFAARRAGPDFLELGRGASSLQEWAMAEEALQHALDLSMSTGEMDVCARAEKALAAVKERRTAEIEQHPLDIRNAPASDVLASRFLSSLQESGLRAVA
jgi:tetratricopeptide (TPR) repeat protein